MLKQLQKNEPKHVSKQNLLWQWRDVDNLQLESLSVHEYNYVLDMLEVSESKNDKKINSKAIKTIFNSVSKHYPALSIGFIKHHTQYITL